MIKFGKNGVYYAFLYIFTLIFIAVFLSVYIIDVANDVFAFDKRDTEITVTLPENASQKQTAKILYENKVIKYPLIYRIYAKLRHDSGKYASGEFILNTAQSYDEIRNLLKK